jgi:hypothetical protein
MADQISTPSSEPTADQMEILKVAFAESIRKLDAVHDAAESVRSRAGTVLAAATAVGGFVGSLAIRASPQGWEWLLAVGGLATYLWSLGLSLHVLLPQRGAWEAGQNTAKLAEASGSTPAWYVYGRLATRYQQSFNDSEQLVRQMSTKVRWAVAAMVVELLFFACLLGVTASRGPTAASPVPASTTTTLVPVATAPSTAAPAASTSSTGP